MKTWCERPKEEAHLLNPFFCCTTLLSATIGYSDVVECGMPFTLSFLVLPTVLHKPTRDIFPTSIRTSLPSWIQENASSRIHFSERVISLNPFTREAILLGLTKGWIELSADCRLTTSLRNNDLDAVLRKLEGDARECVLKARFLGKWFASAGSAQTVMALWGVRP